MTQASARHILVKTEKECIDLKTEIENGLAFDKAAETYFSPSYSP